MEGDLFTKRVKEFDQKFAAQDRKIAHLIADGLKTIELIFLPPKTTSKTQPLDQGVIKSLKAFYRHSTIKRFITSIDGGGSPTKVNMLEAMTLLTAAFPANTIRKSNVILWLYFGNLRKLLSANVGVT